MGMDISSAYCNECKEQRKIERKGTSHLLHFLIMVILGMLTMGVGAIVWLFVWIMASMKFGGWRCSSCGSKNVDIFGNKYFYHVIVLVFVGLFLFLMIKNMGGTP